MTPVITMGLDEPLVVPVEPPLLDEHVAVKFVIGQTVARSRRKRNPQVRGPNG